MDADGFALYIKKLERGTYQWPAGAGTSITSQQLSLLLQGVMLESVRLRKRYTPLKIA
jgi:transposase